MSKKSGSDDADGRKTNRPPEHGKIRPGEKRNPWGRRGKPESGNSNRIDDLLWEIASKTVSYDDDGPVDGAKRLMQSEYHAALANGDGVARARLLAELRSSAERKQYRIDGHLAWVREAKADMNELFELAVQMRKPPPDAMHPDHVEVIGCNIRFRGPIRRTERAAWEWLKAAINVAACLHEIIRNEFRRTPSREIEAELKAIEKHRRQLMRKVPKGWSWKEEIYCRDSQLNFAKETIRKLREIGYVPCSS